MLVFDSAYTYDAIRERNIAAIVTGRDLGGYFAHIWTCHPVATLLKPEGSPERFGRPTTHALAPGHTFIEGRIGRFAWLAWFPILNFLLAQLDLTVMLSRLIAMERIQLLRAEDPHYNGLLAWLLSRLHRRPLLIGVWGNPGEVRRQTGRPLLPRLFRKVWIEERVEKFVLARAEKVMVQNENNRRFVVNCGVPHERTGLFRFSNVLHPVHFTEPSARVGGKEALAELGVDGKPTLLIVSRLQELKLVHHVLYALRTLKDNGQQPVALFVGDGPFLTEMQALARELGISDQVVFCGNQEQTWVAKVIPAVSVVVSPLTGRALGEAGLGGAPIVAYDVDWHGELIESGVTGELVRYLDHGALAAAIAKMLEDPSYAKQMGASVRARAMQMLDPVVADGVQIRTYETVLRTAHRA